MIAGAEVDTTLPFRSIPRLVELVHYVLATSPDNETDWLEWKCGLDLATPHGRFSVAKQLIGFANRDPRRGAAHAGGCGFVVLGAEPGNLVGQPSMDPSKIESALRPYVGTDGPTWQPQTVHVSNVDVLVITVEPSKWGDRIHSLRKEYRPDKGQGAKDGEVFVRRPGGSHPASSAELRMLQDRLVSRPAEGLEIAVMSIGDPICRVDISDEAVEAWLVGERERLLAPLNTHQPAQTDDARGPEADVARLHELLQRMSTSVPERRSPDAYRAEVERYIAAARPTVRLAALNRFEDVVQTPLTVLVRNTGDRNLEAVELVVSFPGPVLTCETYEEDLPAAPRPWGPTPTENSFNIGTFPNDLYIPDIPRPFIELGYTARNHGSTTIEFAPFDLRPYKDHKLIDVPLVVSAQLSRSIHGSWTATAMNRDGRAEGSISVDLTDDVATIDELLAAA